MVQYNAAIIIAGPSKGTSHENLYQELGLKSLADGKWSKKLIFFIFSTLR